VGLVGGELSRQPVVDLGVEDGDADAVGDLYDLTVGVLDPADHPREAKPPQVVGHLAGA
jgi:hypothetical protein